MRAVCQTVPHDWGLRAFAERVDSYKKSVIEMLPYRSQCVSFGVGNINNEMQATSTNQEDGINDTSQLCLARIDARHTQTNLAQKRRYICAQPPTSRRVEHTRNNCRASAAFLAMPRVHWLPSGRASCCPDDPDPTQAPSADVSAIVAGGPLHNAIGKAET